MQIDHVGWITENIVLFESFWCNILGFKCIHNSFMPVEMAANLFNIYSSAEIRRYSRDGSIDIEIHYFPDIPAGVATRTFNRQGINHVCIHTGGKGTRKKFLDQLPKSVEIHIYDNPKGWQNIFLRDYEDSWVELRESLG